MTWPSRQHSKGEIRRAGETLKRWYVGDLVAPDEVEHAQAVLANWRSCHQFALNSAQMGLRQRASSRGIDALVSQRTKSRASIYAKLRRRPDLKLDALRDIAGCRGVVERIEDLRRLQAAYTGETGRVQRDPLDYIERPKDTGYRAVHLDVVYEDRYSDDEPRRVEIQLRTKLQHDWADNVEEVGRRLRCALKNGEGPQPVIVAFQHLSELYRHAEEQGLTPALEREIAEQRSIIDVVVREAESSR